MGVCGGLGGGLRSRAERERESTAQKGGVGNVCVCVSTVQHSTEGAVVGMGVCVARNLSSSCLLVVAHAIPTNTAPTR